MTEAYPKGALFSEVDGRPIEDVVDRLRGLYRVRVDDGGGLLNGLDYHESRVQPSEFIPPIHIQAAEEIERLRAALRRLEGGT